LHHVINDNEIQICQNRNYLEGGTVGSFTIFPIRKLLFAKSSTSLNDFGRKKKNSLMQNNAKPWTIKENVCV